MDVPPQTLERWRRHLSADELARMNRFKFEKDQNRYAICRSRMRRILGWYVSADPADISFGTTGHDKPTLAHPANRDVEFNLTHTNGLACLAVVKGLPVGVDLEERREIKDDFITFALNPDEYAAMLPLPPMERQTAFFQAWTAKEAYLKCIGSGLWQSLKSFDVGAVAPTALGTFEKGNLLRIDNPEQRARNWQLYSFKATPEHYGALAIAPPEGVALNIRTRWFD